MKRASYRLAIETSHHQNPYLAVYPRAGLSKRCDICRQANIACLAIIEASKEELPQRFTCRPGKSPWQIGQGCAEITGSEFFEGSRRVA